MNDLHSTGRCHKIDLAIRVRGMNSDHKFFDEMAETQYVSDTWFITRLQNCLDPDSEIHVTCKATRESSNVRVLWVNDQAREGAYDTGLELLEVEGNLWGRNLERFGEVASITNPEVLVECHRCHTTLAVAVPQARSEFVTEGFTIARHCEQCKGTTRWKFSTGKTAATVRARRPGEADERRKGRAAIKMKIKVYCDRLGPIGEDVCETINVSANGLYFTTSNPYLIGETLRIVAPFEEGAVAIPVPARVVRLDRPQESSMVAVAVELNPGRKGPANDPSLRMA